MKNKDGSTRFNVAEKKLLELLSSAKLFHFNDIDYNLEVCTKPKVEGGGGETKTDIYIKARRNDNNKLEEIKISYKKPNFSFVENKVTPDRAKNIYGENWFEIVKKQVNSIRKVFLSKNLIHFKNGEGTDAGAIKLGWRYEMEYESGRTLKVRVEENIARQVWYNKGSDEKFRDATVDGKLVPDSGIPNYYLETEPTMLKTASDIYSNLVSIGDLVKTHNKIDVAFIAHNYRSHENKHEGDSRDLAVWVDWNVVGGKLKGTLVFDTPLKMKAGPVLTKLRKCLEQLGTPITNGFNIEVLRGKVSSDTRTFG